MKVVMVSKACLVGAYQTKLEEIAKFEDISLTVIVPTSWQDASGEVKLEREHTAGYTLDVAPLRFNGHYHTHYYPDLGRRLRQLQPDILHMDEEPYNLATWLAVRQARKLGAGTLFFSWQNINNRYPWPFRFFERQVLQQVDYALMGNKAAVEVWQAKGYRGPWRVIPQFGVSPELFAPRPPTTDGPIRIGAAGRRLVPEKGLDVLLQSVAELPGSWQLYIAGEGPEQENLTALATQLGIIDRVFFVGPMPSGKMPSFLHRLDILVVPSRTLPNWKEQFGRVLVEAMACEVVAVGSDSGEIPHVIDRAGLTFPEDNVTALKNCLKRLIEDETLRRQLGRAGRERVLAHYTQANIAAQTVAVYREMMADRLPK